MEWFVITSSPSALHCALITVMICTTYSVNTASGVSPQRLMLTQEKQTNVDPDQIGSTSAVSSMLISYNSKRCGAVGLHTFPADGHSHGRGLSPLLPPVQPLAGAQSHWQSHVNFNLEQIQASKPFHMSCSPRNMLAFLCVARDSYD
jgi:hypothetical protein